MKKVNTVAINYIILLLFSLKTNFPCFTMQYMILLKVRIAFQGMLDLG